MLTPLDSSAIAATPSPMRSWPVRRALRVVLALSAPSAAMHWGADGWAHVPRASMADGVLLVSSLAVNLFVVRHERRRGHARSSALLPADASHTASNMLVTALAIGSLLLSRLGDMYADAALGVIVALLIAWSGYQILRHSIPILVEARAVEVSLERRKRLSMWNLHESRT